jgi:hypothetical protein
MDIAPTPELKRFIDQVAGSSGSRENFVETTCRRHMQRRHAHCGHQQQPLLLSVNSALLIPLASMHVSVTAGKLRRRFRRRIASALRRRREDRGRWRAFG